MYYLKIMEALEQQIVLVKYHSLREFKERVKQGKLKLKAQFELLTLRDTTKFEYYVKRFQLDPEAERRLIKSGRKDLYCIYFPLYSCCSSAEELLTHYPRALSVYAKYHDLRENSQMSMVRQKKAKNTLKYLNKRERGLCEKARAFFRSHAEKQLIGFYDRNYGT